MSPVVFAEVARLFRALLFSLVDEFADAEVTMPLDGVVETR